MPTQINKLYKILRFADPQALEVLRETLKTEISSIIGFDLNDLTELHKYISSDQINDLRLRVYTKLNGINWTKLLKKGTINDAIKLLGPDLLIQRKLNLSIQIPGDESSILEAHSDCNSGDSPFELVIWIPLTSAEGSNSMFILSEEESFSYYQGIDDLISKSIKPSPKDFIRLDYGEYLIFPPTLIHGNVLNKTNKTRISINVRIKSIFSPYLKFPVPDRMYAAYYQEWNITDICKLNHKVYNIIK